MDWYDFVFVVILHECLIMLFILLALGQRVVWELRAHTRSTYFVVRIRLWPEFKLNLKA